MHSILRYNATFFPAFRRLSAHGAHTRGNYHPTEIRLLESPSPTKGEICQRDISPPKGRGGMGHRYRAADRSQGTDNDTPISRRPTLRRSHRAPSPRLERGREGHRSFQDCQPYLAGRKTWTSSASRARSRALYQIRKSASAGRNRPRDGRHRFAGREADAVTNLALQTSARFRVQNAILDRGSSGLFNVG